MFKFKTNPPRRNNSAFTIVELLVVIVVIGILAAITIVSYTGISSRATISSLQSDLTNASTTLKLDYVSNGTFPATLASANGGKGITQSQTLDNIIYIPDNTSNPNNFCLQYRKGNNTYAIDNTSAVSSGVCLKNLVTNGDFRDGTTGWSSASALSAINNECYSTPTTQYAGPSQNIANSSNYKSHILYYAAFAKVDSTSVYLILNDGLSQSVIGSSLLGSYTRISGVWTVNSNATNLYTKLQDSRGTGWTTSYVKYWVVIDLTTSFGAGNEPTKAQIDTIMTNYPNSWFNIVAKANL